MNAQQKAKKLYSQKVAAYTFTFMRMFRYHQGVAAFFKQYFPARKHLRLLDAGVGGGTVIQAVYSILPRALFASYHIDAFDITPAMLAVFNTWIRDEKLLNVSGFEADVLALPPQFAKNSYDLIFSSGMLEYLSREDFSKALRILAGKLRTEGRLILFIAKRTPLNALLISLLWKAQTYTRKEIKEALEHAGLQTIVFHRFPHPYAYLNRGMIIVEAYPH